MYYLFGEKDVVQIILGEELSEYEKEKAVLVLDKIPTGIEYKEGKDRVLFLDPETLEVSWFYRDLPIINEEDDAEEIEN